MMRYRKGVSLLALGVGFSLIACQVYSNGTCTSSITGGSATVTSPSSGACYALGVGMSFGGHYGLNWKVTGASGGTPCNQSIQWQQTGGSNDPGVLCGFSDNTTDWILNANIGTTGSFSRSRSWNCVAATLGSWTVTVSTKQGGTTYASTSVGYKVQNSCP